MDNYNFNGMGEPFEQKPPKKEREKTDRYGQAVASLVLGILSILLIITGLFSMILGGIGLGLGISAYRNTNRGEGLAKGGIATSAVGLAISTLLLGATTCMFFMLKNAFQDGITYDTDPGFSYSYPVRPGEGSDIWGSDDIFGFWGFDTPGFDGTPGDDKKPDDNEKQENHDKVENDNLV